MAEWKSTILTGWGRVEAARCQAARPERIGDVRRALGQGGTGGLIAHGAGRSYGDAALNEGGQVLLTGRLDRILSFDAENGEVVAEPGLSFADLMSIFLPRGWLAPVTPGTAFVTLGGAVANDVHGKNHHGTGSFGDHVRWLDLMLPSGEIRRLNPSESLFTATIGGIGLTGIVLAVCFRLQRVPSNAVRLKERRMAGLDDFLAAFAADGSPYSVGWLDALATGASLGRGLLENAVPSPEGIAEKPPRIRTVPMDFPSIALSPVSVAAFNALYRARVPKSGRERLVGWRGFLYPLDAVRDWNRMYGRRGFRQFQAVIPKAEGCRGLRRLLEEIAASRGASFLAVLKNTGAEGRGMLSFPLPGYTLALDFPRDTGTDSLMVRLERIALDHGGRIYLAKDSCLSAQGFAAMYPRLPDFRAVLEEIDPQRRMDSSMARRLSMRGDRP
ncbi:MAG: FAD-binding oxidoreductase [Rhodospirillales bacterium]|nr:FAD-binding oxidoreductase [Rhodospirillales bacterium]